MRWSAQYGKDLRFVRIVPRNGGVFKVGPEGEEIVHATVDETLQTLRDDPAVQFAFPAYVNPRTGLKVYLNDQLVVRFRAAPGVDTLREIGTLELRIKEALSEAENIYILELQRPKSANPLEVSRLLHGLVDVLWAEPNLASQVQRAAVPWHLENTGQWPGAPLADADIDGTEAWTGSQGHGNAGIRVAVLDDGVELNHPDLKVVPGYDFFANTPGGAPQTVFDNHGTEVAGAASAAVNTATVTAGVSPNSSVLPVRIYAVTNSAGKTDGPVFSDVYRAFVYAADNADVINCSWGWIENSTITAGISYANSSGRGGKGCGVFVSSGNDASGHGVGTYGNFYSFPFAAGQYYFRFVYKKNLSDSVAPDCVYLADVRLPNGTYERLETNTVPWNWSTSASAPWFGVIDPKRSHGTSQYAYRSGSISDDQESYIQSPLTTVPTGGGHLIFRVWTASAVGDEVRLRVYTSLGVQVMDQFLAEGTKAPPNTNGVNYPASLSTVVAVGASSDRDLRSHYSQYGSALDVVAPSHGGYAGISTTDRSGTDGDSSTAHVYHRSGTSFAAPQAAGLAALLLSRDGNQLRSTVISRIYQTCDKIGTAVAAYSGSPSRNDYFGHGRINAYAAVLATPADTTAPTMVAAVVANYRAVDVIYSEPMGGAAEAPSLYTLTAGANTLNANPDKVVRLTPTTYRLIWTSGEIATSGTVTVQASRLIDDAAGNKLPQTGYQSSTGTKRIRGVQCGGIPSNGPGYLYFEGYHMDNVEFSGVDFVGKAIQSGGYHQSNYTYNSITTTGITDPAPQKVYQSYRQSSLANGSFTYTLSNIPAGNKNIRFHFAENYYNYIGDQKFNIKVNGTQLVSNYDILSATGGVKHKAATYTLSGIPPVNGSYLIEFIPSGGNYSTASVNAIEVLNP